MLITVTGCSSETAKALMDAARFYGRILLHGRTLKNIVLDIDVKNKIDSLDSVGDCSNEDGTKRSRWFTISLKRASINSMIQTLAHEMVHLKQYVKNELGEKKVIVTRGSKIKVITYWNGKPWVPNSKQDPYFDSPWEVEAFGREVGLFYRYRKEKELNKNG